MNIPILGPLKPHPDIPEWLVSEPLQIQYFDDLKLTVTLDGLEDADAHDVERAVDAFFKLGAKDRLAASQYVFENYRKMADLVYEDDLGCRIDLKEEVWSHVHASEIFISKRHRRDRAIYISITAACDWEREHGLQIIYRSGAKLSRVSAQDGHLTHTDAYNLPEDQDKIVS